MQDTQHQQYNLFEVYHATLMLYLQPSVTTQDDIRGENIKRQAIVIESFDRHQFDYET